MHTYSPGVTYSITAGDLIFIGGFNNIANSSTKKMSLRGIINFQVFADPPVPSFNTYVQDTVPCDQNDYNDYTAHPGFQSPDNDSLSYSIDMHSDIQGYTPPPVGFTTIAGSVITFTANAAGIYNVSYRVDSWRQSIANGPYDIVSGSSFLELFLTVCNIYNPPTGILMEELLNFFVFPNPANGTLYIDAGDRLDLTAVISDLHGRILLELDLQSGRNTLIFPADKGIYVLTAQGKDGVLAHRQKIVRE